MKNDFKMSFKDHYISIKTSHAKLRDDICRLLEISEKTFYNRMADDSWTYPEKIVISNYLNSSVEILFPENAIV